MTPTEQDKELREKLAAIEHERWADWQRYVHSVCYENKGIGGEPTGELTIPSELARRWERQIGTPYHELSEKEKDSDREQVDRYWQLITADRKRVELEAELKLLSYLLDEYAERMFMQTPYTGEITDNCRWACNTALTAADACRIEIERRKRIAELKAQQEKLNDKL